MSELLLQRVETPMKIILGSSSPFRQKMFSNITTDFESMSPDIDEKAIRDHDPETLTLRIAHAKADALIPNIAGPALLVTADQVIVFEGEIREKPLSKEQARDFIRSYAQKLVEVVNGVVVTNTATGKRAEGTDKASVTYKASLATVVDEIIENSLAMQAAGALVVENHIMRAHEESRIGDMDSFWSTPEALIKRLMEEVQ